jgi:hypothetical protein
VTLFFDELESLWKAALERLSSVVHQGILVGRGANLKQEI